MTLYLPYNTIKIKHDALSRVCTRKSRVIAVNDIEFFLIIIIIYKYVKLFSDDGNSNLYQELPSV